MIREEEFAEFLELGFSEDDISELLETQKQDFKKRLELKDLPDDVFIELILNFLRKNHLICDYAIVGGMAYNRYLSKSYEISTPDIDIKLFNVDQDSYLKCVENFIPHLQDYIENEGYVWPFSLVSNTTLNMYQLKYGDIDVLDIGMSDVPINIVVIDDVNYASIKYLLDQLEKYRGLAGSFGMDFKETRRQHRESNLQDSLKNIHILDETIYARLCEECKTESVEHLTGKELNCADIRSQCETTKDFGM